MSCNIRALRLALSSILFLSFGSVAVASWAESQYIFYNTTLSGHYTHPDGAPHVCTDYYFDDIINFNVKIGVNPDWDPNAWWFSLVHEGNLVDDCDEWACTADAIYDMAFQSSVYECYQFNSPCPSGYVEEPFYFVGLQLLDLNDTTTTEYSALGLNNEHGYTVVGDNSSWVSNQSVVPYFDFQIPSNYTLNDGCTDQLQFQWNSSTPFTYSLNFTNSTVSGLFSISAPEGSVSFSFNGSRTDHVNDPDNLHLINPVDFDTWEAIELSNDTSSIPVFLFADSGDSIEFTEDDGNYYVSAASSAKDAMGGSTLQFVLGTMFVGALLL